jgi:uncharacterized Zn finger protein
MNSQQRPQAPRLADIDLATQSTAIVCAACGNAHFNEVMSFRKVSRLLAMTPNDTIVSVPLVVCTKCGAVNEELTPSIEKK